MPSEDKDSHRSHSGSKDHRHHHHHNDEKKEDAQKESDRIFRKMDADGSNTATKEEMARFVKRYDDLWYKINDKLKQPKEVAREAATRTAMELATGLEGQEALDAELTSEQFHEFRQKYVLDEDGKQEFFQRAVFNTFDADSSGELDQNELKHYVDAIYETREVRKGRVSVLAPKETQALILKQCDKDGDGGLSYEEVSKVLGGGAQAFNELKLEARKEATTDSGAATTTSASSSDAVVDTKKESDRIFRKMDADGSNTATKEEMANFIRKNDDLWYKINSRLKQPKDIAHAAATRTAMELATGLEGHEALEAELTKKQFHEFREKYVLDEEGKQEFFQRAIFDTFDVDHSGELDQWELKNYVDAIYESREVRKGRVSLLAKDDMQKLILQKCDKDGDGTLSYNEVSKVLGGGAEGLNQLKNQPESIPETEQEDEKEKEENTGVVAAGGGGGAIIDKEVPVDELQLSEREGFDFCDWLDRSFHGMSPCSRSKHGGGDPTTVKSVEKHQSACIIL